MDARERNIGKTVYTQLGRGRIVYLLADGSFVVEFEHGGGHIFRPEELFARRREKQYPWSVEQPLTAL